MTEEQQKLLRKAINAYRAKTKKLDYEAPQPDEAYCSVSMFGTVRLANSYGDLAKYVLTDNGRLKRVNDMEY